VKTQTTTLLKKALRGFFDDNAMRLAASLAFYTVWSIGPLFLIVVSIAGLFYGRESAQGYIVGGLGELVGPQGAHEIDAIIAHAWSSGHSLTANVVGIVTLVVAASGVTAELQSSLNQVWEVAPKSGSFLATLRARFLSLTMVLALGFLLLVSLVFNAAISAAGKHLHGRVPGGEVLEHVIHLAASFTLTTLVFCLIFKLIPDAIIRWRDVWLGGVVTSVLFTLAQLLIGLYVGKTTISTAYGAASSLMIVLVWIFFSSCILFLGAEFTREYAEMFGERIKPDKNAVQVPEGTTAAAATRASTRVTRTRPSREPR
jgi:membrane protein